MNEKESQKSTVGWPGIMLIAALTSNLLWLHAPLKSARPKEESRFQTASLGDQTAEARLWQDPFEAVSLHRNKPGTGGTSNAVGTDIQGMVEQIHRRLKHGTNLVLLPVMVTGIPYTEGTEWRVRTRYAVLSGLDRAGYVTQDRSHVGFFEVGWPRGAELSATNELTALTCGRSGATLNLTVPFEWLEHYDSSSTDPDSSHDYVLVLWLEEEKFEDAPLTRLALLIHGLRERAALETNTPAIPVKIIGPYGSTTLRAMARNELAGRIVSTNGPTIVVSNALGNVTIFSGSATAADWRIDPRKGDKTNQPALHPTNEFRTRIGATLSKKAPGLSFTNVTCTDDQLAWQLVKELDRRGVDLSNDVHQVVLISEWDTFYGRALPQSFSNAVFHLGGHDSSNAAAAIWQFNYLRGLDGKLAGKEESPRAGSSSGQGEKVASPAANLNELERPEGNNQLDYIPRLAGKLRNLEEESRRGLRVFTDRWSRKGRIEAIGLLGSDVYDKLLLLQSLRAYFPEAIFFTTDLDARLAHPSQIKWSRNMIVASSFGFELSQQWQENIPPFRDSYQTAQFLAVLLAMRVYTNDIAESLVPRLFEIGRTGPYDLSVDKAPFSLHPPRANEYPSAQSPGVTLTSSTYLQREIRLGLALGVLTLVLLIQISPRVRRILCWPFPKEEPNNLLLMLILTAFVFLPEVAGMELRLGLAGVIVMILSVVGAPLKRKQSLGRMLGAAAVCVGLILLCAYCRIMLKEHLSAEGEPFSFVAGISVWPTELIRLVAAGLGIGLLVKAVLDLHQDTMDLVESFALEAPEQFLDEERKKNFRRQLEENTFSNQGTFRRILNSILGMGWKRRRISIYGWEDTEMNASIAEGSRKRVSGELMWKRYILLGNQWYCWLRFLPAAITYLAAGCFLVNALGQPFCPYRGAWSKGLDLVALILSVAVFVVLTFFVMDATRLCTRFIDLLSQRPTLWPPGTFELFQAKTGLEPASLDEAIDIQFIAKRTKAVGRMIYYPFVLLFLMIVARNDFFDAWTWPISLTVLLSVNAAYALFSAFHLRRKAEQARGLSLVRLNEKLSQELGAIKDGKTNSNRAEQLRLLIREIESKDEGAFAPLSKQPVVGALLMPFGGAGILALLEYLATMH